MELTHKCTNCNDNHNDKYTIYINKNSIRFGYMKDLFVPRFFCSEECMNNFKRITLCNLCNSIIYDESIEYNGYNYHNENIIGEETCYNIKQHN
jgi:hypothetical protein